ncbi:MAG: hypothetical protein GY870_09975, partial [archaeon]|nr:hypothetical protein [archaeon]
NVSQQFYFDTYPAEITSVEVMIYKDQLVASGGLIARIFEADENGYPVDNSEIGGSSDFLAYDDINESSNKEFETFEWSSNNPILYGNVSYGYCLVLEANNTLANYNFHAVVTTDYSYSKGIFSSCEREEVTFVSQLLDNLVFNITCEEKYFATVDFSIDITDFGISLENLGDFIQELNITCNNIATTAAVESAGVTVHSKSNNMDIYTKFGNITESFQNFSILITEDFNDYLLFGQNLTVRFFSGGADPHNLTIDLLSINMTYSNDVFSFDRANGMTGIGEYFLEIFSVTNNTTYLEKAFEIGEYIIYSAINTTINGLECASWDFGDEEYKTSISDGVAGVGSFLLQLGKLNNSDTKFREFAKRSANWLIVSMETEIPVYDQLGNYIGMGNYWGQTNISGGIVYNGYLSGIAGIADFLVKVGMSEAEEGNVSIYLNNANLVGNYLISTNDTSGSHTSAYNSYYSYYWTTSDASISPDLSYSTGTAGVMIFLNNLYHITHNTNYSRGSSRAYEYLQKNAKNGTIGKYWNNSLVASSGQYGLYQGVAGIALSLHNIRYSSFDAIQSSQMALDWLYDQKTNISDTEHVYNETTSSSTYYSGLAKGTAGVGMAFLDMYKATGNNTYFTRASYCANALDQPSDWSISNDDSNIRTGIADGVAGIGLFILEMSKISSDSKYSDTLISIANYLDTIKDTSYVDYSWKYSDSGSGIGDNNYYGWDKGASGISYFFTELYKFYNNNSYLQIAESAARWIIDNDEITDPGCWELYYGAGGNNYYSFSDGSAGIGFFLLNLYETTNNMTYYNNVTQIYDTISQDLDGAGVPEDSSDSVFYSGVEKGQAGILNFLSKFYENNRSSTVSSNIEGIMNFYGNSQYRDVHEGGTYIASSSDDNSYRTYSDGTAGIIGGLVEYYASTKDSNTYSTYTVLDFIYDAKNNLTSDQNSDGSWDDITNLGYYNGIAGIADQLMKVPDVEKPFIYFVPEEPYINITSLSSIQYLEDLQISLLASDSASNLEDILIVYSVNNYNWYEESFIAGTGDFNYTMLINSSLLSYNTNISFFMVAIDKTGMISIEDNSSSFYNYTYQDNTAPQYESIKSYYYDEGYVEGPVQYATGGAIVATIDEPAAASGIDSVNITYQINGETEIEFAMTDISGPDEIVYSYDIVGTGLEYSDVLTFNISAYDIAGNIGISEQNLTTIGDSSGAQMDIDNTSTYMLLSPNYQAFLPIGISVCVFDDIVNLGSSGIKAVYINYSIDDLATWQSVQLSKSTDHDNEYKGEIPGIVFAGTTVYFTICVEDNAGNVVYFDNMGNPSSIPTGYSNELFFFDISINWIMVLIIVIIIAACSVIGYYMLTKNDNYWDKMRRQADTTATLIGIQEKLTTIYFVIASRLITWGNWITDKFTRPPGMPNPVVAWIEEHFGQTGTKIINYAKLGTKKLLKGSIKVILSPFYGIVYIVKNASGGQIFLSAIFSLMLILLTVVRYLLFPPYPLRALFFINFGFILFIATFLVLIFHLIYDIAYK